MAGDWIKMRVLLHKDPHVIAMADYLARDRAFMNWVVDAVCEESVYECVTRNVTVALCVTGLLVTWGVSRERGDSNGVDLVLLNASLETLNAISEIPHFGEAMAHVGWAIEEKGNKVIFPKFFKEHESPEDRHRRQAAERQKRFRDKLGIKSESNASNVTVTHREEKRREDDDGLDAKASNLVSRIDWESHLAIWNNEIAPMIGSPAVRKLNDERKKKLRATLLEYPNLWELVREECRHLNQFMRKGRHVTFDFILSPSRLTRLLEGTYRNEEGFHAAVQAAKPTDEELVAEYLDELNERKAREADSQGEIPGGGDLDEPQGSVGSF